ncbi:TPA: hypothetical protein ACIARL_004057, partial [Salmonella enterica subsp. enterica serovar Eastbourne]
KNTIQIDASPLPVNVVYGSFPPFVRVSNMNVQVLTTNASVSPKISRHSCAWRWSRNRTADISAEWNPG